MTLEPKDFVDIELKIINMMFEAQKEIYPMVVLIKDDKRFQVPVSYSNSAHKDIVSQGIKDLVRTSDPDVVVYVAEAWTKVIQGKLDRLPTNIAQDPERIEIVTVQIEFKTGEKYGCSAQILRDGVPHLSKFEVNPFDLSFGRFTDFFPIKRFN